MLQTVNIKFDFNQLILMVQQCDQKQKLAIMEALEKDTFKLRFKKLVSELKDNNLTANDVIKEVEAVRTKRYNSENRKK